MANHNVVSMQAGSADELTQVLRDGAQRLLANAIESEVKNCSTTTPHTLTENGRAGVVRLHLEN